MDLEEGQEWLDIEEDRIAHITYVSDEEVAYYVGNEFYESSPEWFKLIFTRQIQ